MEEENPLVQKESPARPRTRRRRLPITIKMTVRQQTAEEQADFERAVEMLVIQMIDREIQRRRP